MSFAVKCLNVMQVIFALILLWIVSGFINIPTWAYRGAQTGLVLIWLATFFLECKGGKMELF
jgi:hypothetical protein